MSGRVDESDSDAPEEFTAQQVGSILALKPSSTTTHICIFNFFLVQDWIWDLFVWFFLNCLQGIAQDEAITRVQKENKARCAMCSNSINFCQDCIFFSPSIR